MPVSLNCYASRLDSPPRLSLFKISFYEIYKTSIKSYFMKFIGSLLWFRSLAIVALLGAITPSVKAEHVKGILVPSIIASGSNKLHLNGTAIRAKWGFSVYVVALYMTKVNRGAEAIMLDRDPKRIHITMLHSVSEKRFVSTIEKNIDVNFSAEEKVKYAKGLTDFMGCFHGGTSLNKYSTIDIDYLPGKGMMVAVDGNKFELIPGDDFYHAIMRLWIGDPPQLSLKTGLVGKD